MPKGNVIKIIDGPGRWDLNIAISEPLKNCARFRLERHSGDTEVSIVRAALCSPDMRLFAGVALGNKDSDLYFSVAPRMVWVRGMYQLGGKDKGWLETCGLFKETPQPVLPKGDVQGIRPALEQLFGEQAAPIPLS